MNILLDECVPKRFGSLLFGHHVSTVCGAGWAGVKSGELLSRAEKEYDAFVTADRNLAFQQPTHCFKTAVVMLQGATNRLAELSPLAPQVLDALVAAEMGKVYRIG